MPLNKRRQRLNNLLHTCDPDVLRRMIDAVAPDKTRIWRVWYLVPDGVDNETIMHRVGNAYRSRFHPRYFTVMGGHCSDEFEDGILHSKTGLPWSRAIDGSDHSRLGTEPMLDLRVDGLFLPVCGVSVCVQQDNGYWREIEHSFFRDILALHPELKHVYAEELMEWIDEEKRLAAEEARHNPLLRFRSYY
ncbi:MAG: hypothetical protein WCV84_00410 [Patescibacteria group bacterium]